MGNAGAFTRVHTLLWVCFRRSVPATLAHGEGAIDLIGVGAQLSPRVRISRLEACHDAWGGTELAGGDHDWNGVASNRRLVTCVTKTRYTGTKGECASVWSSDGQIATIKQASHGITA